MKNNTEEGIAIVGVSFRFPEADSLAGLHDILAQGADSVKELNKQRKEDARDYFQKVYDNKDIEFSKASYLKDISGFDHKFFNISYEEAVQMDPAQRLLLQNAYHCFADAGYVPDNSKNNNIGTFVAYGSDHEYKEMLSKIKGMKINSAAIYTLSSFAAARLAHYFNLTGPLLTIDTTCSSSLVVLHEACHALDTNECESALVAGIQIFHLPVSLGDIGIQSQQGMTRTFDDDCDGTVCGEGICSILIKPVKEARKNKDKIYAIIRGSAVNGDGTSATIASPNPMSQRKVICKAWENAHVDPSTVTYIEAHGTGTQLGDTIELYQLSEVFRSVTDKKHFCAVSSVKSNIGHLGYCAGLAGIVKCILQFQERVIYPTAHFKVLNQNVDLKNSAIYVSDCLTPWVNENGPRRCGISSFGISGTNCHMVLEENSEYKDVVKQENKSEQHVFHDVRCVLDFSEYENHIEKKGNTEFNFLRKLNGMNCLDEEYTLTELILIYIFNKFLGSQQISKNCNIFDYGIDSILLYIIIDNMETIYDYHIDKDIFYKYKTISAIAGYLDKKCQKNDVLLRQ